MTAPWLDTARAYIGTREYPGSRSNPVILGFWKLARLSGIKDDLVPWCSGFACAMLEANGIRSTRSDAAKSWLTWGYGLATPCLGAIVVLKREGGYHVGFAVGQTREGRLLILGGNQGDSVCVAAFECARVVGVRWPQGVPETGGLPVLPSVAGSRSEA